MKGVSTIHKKGYVCRGLRSKKPQLSLTIVFNNVRLEDFLKWNLETLFIKADVGPGDKETWGEGLWIESVRSLSHHQITTTPVDDRTSYHSSACSSVHPHPSTHLFACESPPPKPSC